MSGTVGLQEAAVSLPVRLPFIVRAMDGPREVDVVPVDGVVVEPSGRLTVSGRGRRFEARAVWTPVAGPVRRWDVTLDIRVLGRRKVRAGLVAALRLDPVDDPHWLIPGLFYGENRPSASRARYPRFAAAGVGDEWSSPAWSFRSDRAATPAVFARDAVRGLGLATTERSAVGLTGLGFSGGADGTEVRLLFPYREEPVSYDGSPTPGPADLPAHEWRPEEPIRLAFRVYLTEPTAYAWAPVLRDLQRWHASTAPLAPWVDPPTAARLAAEGLRRWHYRPDPGVLLETASFDRPEPSGDRHEEDPRATGPGDAAGDRVAMHVAWLSGTPAAAALLAHGRRVGDAASADAGRRVMDAIASNLAPCGTFWGQWTEERGWTKGWTPGEDRLHARTLGEATLFMARAAAAGEDDTGLWRRAVASNLDFVVGRQRADGAIPAAWHAQTGQPAAWDGTAGLAWVPALVAGAGLLERADLLDAAGRAGAWYAQFVEDELLFGAPEDVDLGPTSEDGYVAVMAYVALAESTPGADPAAARDRWLALARRAADWMLTFRYSYNVAFAPDTTLGRHDYRSRGADQASPANQHLHAYGLVCLPEMVRLARLTGDPEYAARSRENLACFRQFIARHDGDFGARRGMAPERLYQTACFGPKGELGPMSHAWCLGLLLWACDAAADLPELGDTSG
jgi:hypothetical protein